MNAKEFYARQRRRRVEALRAEEESKALGNEALLISPQFDPLQPLPRGPVNFAPPRPPDPRDNWVGKLDAVARGAAGVLTAGGIDEGAAGADAFLHPVFNTGNPGETYSQRYEKNLQTQRAIDQSDYENRYGYRLAGQIGGGILAAYLLSRGGIGAAPRTLQKMAAQRALTVKNAATNYRKLLLASGADSIGLGALHDFGNAKDGLWNRTEHVIKGALPNAAAGIAAPVVAQAVTEAAKPVLKSLAEQVKSQFSEQIKRQTESMIVNALGVRGRAQVRELVSIRNALDYKPRSQPTPKLTSQQKQQLRFHEFDEMLKNGGIAQGFISPFLPRDQ